MVQKNIFGSKNIFTYSKKEGFASALTGDRLDWNRDSWTAETDKHFHSVFK